MHQRRGFFKHTAKLIIFGTHNLQNKTQSSIMEFIANAVLLN